MKIVKVAIGNNKEAFIEDRFIEKVNVISSDDNNRGKTILIQGMMYTLGNTPTFPVSFDYKNYYYIVEFEVNKILFKVCRNKDEFIVKTPEGLRHFENVSEFRRYWDREIYHLPQIIKNNRQMLVHPELYLQLFFVGQDKKNTSNISNTGYYNKTDFINMLLSMCGINVVVDETEIQKNKDSLKELVHQKKLLIKNNKILNSKRKEISYLSTTADRAQFKNNLDKIEKINEEITALKKERFRYVSRKSKCESAILEIRSLNREMNTGEIVCLECGSIHIGYKTSSKNDHAFDISTSDIRKDIIKSLEYKIIDINEEIERINIFVNEKQNALKKLMFVDEISLESLLFYKDQLFNAEDAESKVQELDEQIRELESIITMFEIAKDNGISTKKEIISNVLFSMNEKYKNIDPNGTLFFDSLFTKKTETYSGSEATIFYLLKMYIYQNVTSHSNPIIVDSFRSEDLSTEKEKKFLELFDTLSNQIIFTTTLKTEEIGKYDKEEFKFVNHIDYSTHIPSSILNEGYLDYFKIMLKEFIHDFN